MDNKLIENWNWKAIIFGACGGFIIGLLIGGIFF